MPDEQSAVVYFIGFKSGSVWDGETPIGEFEGNNILSMPWKTTPGEHYFLANTFNWITMRANLQANKTYYVKLERWPNPVPFSQNLVSLKVMEPEDAAEWIKYSRNASFTDEWRAEFAQGKLLQEVKENLQEAKADKSMEISLN
ncbi:MAG: hypothetical protein LBU82_04785 [Treponema sp.]|nr:hypothetical protein [Treponema sp.]